jgi:hypothetical protein
MGDRPSPEVNNRRVPVTTPTGERHPVVTAGTVLVVFTIALGTAGCTGPAPSTSRAGSGTVTRTGAVTKTGLVTRTALPATYPFSQVTSDGSRLAVSAEADGPGCRRATATVDPTSLRLGPLELSACSEPDFAGQRAAPDLDYLPGSSTETFSVAVKTSGGRFATGPVLATFEAPAGDHPSVTSADGSFWVWGTPVSGGHSRVTEVSAATGAVVETVTLPGPDFGTPLTAADDDGLWLALPPNTGPNTSPTSVYFVPKRHGTVRVTALGARAAWWLVASGHQMWLDTLPEAGSSDDLWTATGPKGEVRRLETVAFPAAAGTGAAVAGNGDLWTLDSATSDSADCAPDETVNVVRVAPGDRVTPVASVGVPAAACRTPLPGPGAFVYRRGYLYVLAGSPSVLYRVRV